MSDFERIYDAIDLAEMEAVKHFGEDKIGTKEKRLALPQAEKVRLLNFLMARYPYWARRTGESMNMFF